MSDKPISPLRQRMIDDMTARRVKEKVQKDYVRHVRAFAAFLGRSPDTATSEDLRRFQVHLARPEIGVATINAAIAALRFFFNVTLQRPDLVRPLTIENKPRKAPIVLSQEAQLRYASARAERRHPRDPGVARNRHILPATTRSRDESTIRFHPRCGETVLILRRYAQS